jgi:hypothetical protein
VCCEDIAKRKGSKEGTGKAKGKYKKRAGAMMSVAAERPIVGKWYIDSCCSNHVSPDVLYVPDATANLLSVSNTVKKGYCMFFSADKGCQIFDSKGCQVTGKNSWYSQGCGWNV